MLEVEAVERPPECVRRRGELQAHERAARAQHAEHFRKRLFAVGHVADAVRHGDDVVAGIRVGDVLGIHDFEVDGHALVLSLLFHVPACYVEHFGHKIGALDVARPLFARHGKGDVARAACDVKDVVGVPDGRHARHSVQPAFVRPEARDGVEPFVFARNAREDVLHALGGDFGRRFLAGGGIDAMGCGLCGHGVSFVPSV